MIFEIMTQIIINIDKYQYFNIWISFRFYNLADF